MNILLHLKFLVGKLKLSVNNLLDIKITPKNDAQLSIPLLENITHTQGNINGQIYTISSSNIEDPKYYSQFPESGNSIKYNIKTTLLTQITSGKTNRSNLKFQQCWSFSKCYPKIIYFRGLVLLKKV